MLARFYLLLMFLGALPVYAQNAPGPSRIYYDIDDTLIQGQKVSAAKVSTMVDGLVMTITGKRNTRDAWLSLVRPTDRVGIKVSTTGGEISGTHPEIVDAIVEGLINAGIPKEQIIVWDRRKQDLLAAGFTTKNPYYQLHWVDEDGGDGYDKKNPITAPVLGKLIWGDQSFKKRSAMRFSEVLSQKDQLSDESHVANTLANRVTKIINIPTLSDSYYTGVGGAIPNMTLSNLDNWRRFIKPPMYGDPYLAEIYSDPKIAGKVVLTVLDAIVIQYAGGPFPDPRYASNYFGIYMSKDPVAIDATAMRIIDEYRVPRRLPKIEPISTYIQSAASIGLGNFNENLIEKIKVDRNVFR
ncbi:MAG: DUF362 domain-containing protein [Chthoniobacterales bacterium]